MTLVVGNVQETSLLNYLLTQNNQYIRLYVNDYTPDNTSVTASFTEMSTHSYAQKELVTADWTITNTASGSTAQNLTQTWTFTEAAQVIVYGYYLVDTITGDLVYAERFPSSQVIVNEDDQIVITPKITIE